MATLKITTIERESTLLGGKIVLNDFANAGSWQINVLGGPTPNLQIGRPGSNPILSIIDTSGQKGLIVPNTITVGTGSTTTIGSGITTNGLIVNGTLQINGPSAFAGTLTANTINVNTLAVTTSAVIGTLSITGDATGITPQNTDNSTKFATTAFVRTYSRVLQQKFFAEASPLQIKEYISDTATTFNRTATLGVGKKVLELSITPTQPNSKILVEVAVFGAVQGGYPAIILFKNNVYNGGNWDNNYGQLAHSKTSILYSAEFLSDTNLTPITFYVHAGSLYSSEIIGNFRLNRGYDGNNYLGGATQSWIKITEYI